MKTVDALIRAISTTGYTPTLGELKIPDITAADISALLLSMQSAGKANATCVKVYTILHSLFKMAYMSDVLSVNPMDRVGRPKPRKSERRDKPIEAYTASELQRIFSAIDTEPLKWRVLMRLLIVIAGLVQSSSSRSSTRSAA